ncbi:MAG: hypothetical protein QXE05_12245, partial [Nitrososphaeria archaeon]
MNMYKSRISGGPARFESQVHSPVQIRGNAVNPFVERVESKEKYKPVVKQIAYHPIITKPTLGAINPFQSLEKDITSGLKTVSRDITGNPVVKDISKGLQAVGYDMRGNPIVRDVSGGLHTIERD